MAQFALDLVLWFTGVRGHIPRFDDFRPVPVVPTAGASSLMRILAVMAAVIAVLTLTVWGTVWVAIRLL
jgi:hypothetical protein